jgi:hypothetical protein
MGKHSKRMKLYIYIYIKTILKIIFYKNQQQLKEWRSNLTNKKIHRDQIRKNL